MSIYMKVFIWNIGYVTDQCGLEEVLVVRIGAPGRQGSGCIGVRKGISVVSVLEHVV